MTFAPNMAEVYFGPDGRPTVTGQKLLQSMTDRITTAESALGDALQRLTAAESKLTAIAAVAGPVGGSTTDTEARAAINAILAAAS